MPMIDVNGIKLHYHLKGRGLPILFIHPPLLTSENFNYQLEQLSDQFTVVVFDIRGHGHSEASAAPITYTLISSDIQQLMNALNIKKCYLAGYSTGGGIALDAMLTYPDRFYGGILISAMSEVSDPWLKFRISMAERMCDMKAKKLLSWAISYGNADMDITYRNLMESALKGNLENMKQYYSISKQFCCTDSLRYLKIPQLLVYGEKDKAFHRYAKMLKKELPSSQLYYIRGLRHQLPTKAPYKLNGLIRKWITEHQEMGLNNRVLTTLDRVPLVNTEYASTVSRQHQAPH
ncbi:alpha/beta fold hydrolase [Marinicrinis lubricantis]|uniref:Alpha/beta fold hydrolase n=1 Tax=Marinicrinis lubricantis TaxID=2086470 RepID=A0ABW1IUQ4_9BACL